MYRVTLSFEAKDTGETDLLINAMSDGFTTAVTKLGNGSLNIYTVEEEPEIEQPERADLLGGTIHQLVRAFELSDLNDYQRELLTTHMKELGIIQKDW